MILKSEPYFSFFSYLWVFSSSVYEKKNVQTIHSPNISKKGQEPQFNSLLISAPHILDWANRMVIELMSPSTDSRSFVIYS